MAEVTGSLPRPQLRGMLKSRLKSNLIGVGISCTIAGLYMKFVFGNGRKKNYAEFYKNYDIEKDFETMRKKGLFDSCDTD